MIKDVPAIRFTTDICSSNVCPLLPSSLTAHWLDVRSDPQSVVFSFNTLVLYTAILIQKIAAPRIMLINFIDIGPSVTLLPPGC